MDEGSHPLLSCFIRFLVTTSLQWCHRLLCKNH